MPKRTDKEGVDEALNPAALQPTPQVSPKTARTRILSMQTVLGAGAGRKSTDLLRHPDAQTKARLLYYYCIASESKVTETVHSLFTIAEHYAGENPSELDSPEVINGIPRFFKSLTAQEKAEFCYNQVTEALSTQALPVTVNSLLATRRLDPDDPSSSVAGRFVQRVTRFVCGNLLILFVFFLLFEFRGSAVSDTFTADEIERLYIGFSWVAFGCVGALVHLLNHALTTTRLQTFDASEERKIWPRVLLGGMFGFVLPWVLSTSSTALGTAAREGLAVGPMAAFFAGYSVRFSIGLLERVLAAVLPETKTR